MLARTFARLVALACLMGASVGTWAAGADQYRLGAGDIISINVFGEEDLSLNEVRVGDGGKFSYPFLGEINARGKTSDELQKLLRDGLKDGYLVDPRVSVRILEFREFFVNGEVENPGGYPFKPGLTLRKAVALAGGFTERASKSKITVIAEQDGKRTPREAKLDTPIMPGDIITVDQSFF